MLHRLKGAKSTDDGILRYAHGVPDGDSRHGILIIVFSEDLELVHMDVNVLFSIPPPHNLFS